MPMSEENRKAAGERLRLAREAKQAEKRAATTALEDEARALTGEPEPTEPTVQAEPTITQTEYSDLLKQIEQLKRAASSQFSPTPAQLSEPQMNQRGHLIGTFEKYGIDPKGYPNPCERLAQEPRLRRFAFDVNYELSFAVTSTRYQTLDGINTLEPRFTLELIKIVMDEDTGEPTNGRYVLRTMMLHEDPQAALMVARENGLAVDEVNQADFLNEMRYLRMRDWLVEAFYPPRNTGKQQKREMVMNNQVVQYFEMSSSDSASIDFKDLNGKIRG